MRRFTLACIVVLMSFLSHNSVSKTSFPHKVSPPNFLIIITDDQNDWSFFDKASLIQTPSLDKLKRESLVFKNAHTASPVCGASRTAFFSGLYPHTTGAYYNGSFGWLSSPILQKNKTVTEYFRDNGYITYGQGKLFHAKMAPEKKQANWDNQPHAGGFGPFPSPEYFVTQQGDQGNKFWGVQAWTGPDTDFPDVRNGNAVMDFLHKKHEKPFLAVYGLWRPHTPFTAPKRFFDQYNAKDIPLPKGYKPGDLSDVSPHGHILAGSWKERWHSSGSENKAQWKRILHGYYASMSFADWNVGRVIDALDHSPNQRDTVVIFWSDNGYHLGEKDHFEKATVWEAASHIPMAIRMPTKKNGGKTVAQPVTNVDLFPTLVELAGLPDPKQALDGRSLSPLLKKPKTRWNRPAIVSYGPQVFSARSERYRYIRYPDGFEELYDHQRDPYEWRNVIDEPRYADVKHQMAEWNPKVWAPSMGGRVNETGKAIKPQITPDEY